MSVEPDRNAFVDLTLRAAQVFQPRTPISARALFAGRWEQMTLVADSVAQAGLHIVIFGERGVGKTSLANVIDPVLQVLEEHQTDSPVRLVAKVNVHSGDDFGDIWRRAFDEIGWSEEGPAFGFTFDTETERVTLREKMEIPDDPSIDDVRRVLSALPFSVFIFDEFDRGSKSTKGAFTDLIKALSDYGINSTIVVVGVSDTIDELVEGHASITRAVVQIQLPRMNEHELHEILAKGSKALGMEFDSDAANLTVRISQGLPHYVHLIGLHATREAAKKLSRTITANDVHESFKKCVDQAIQTIQHSYLAATHSARRDALYRVVVLACAIATSTAKDALGFFHPSDVVEPLSDILNRGNVTIATFQKHINELCASKRGPVLDRQGIKRAYKYRFLDPMMLPYVFMNAVSVGIISAADLNRLTTR